MAGKEGHLTEQVVGLAGSQVLVLGCRPHILQAGTSNALTVWLALRVQPALKGEGALQAERRGTGSWSPEAGFPRL